MRIAITGASGFVGSALVTTLADRGDEVVAARRGKGSELQWSVDDGFDPGDALSGFDAVIHLAGDNIGVRWSDARKRSILSSRVEGTRRVVEALQAASPRPSTFICASAIGFYGDTADREVDEHDGPGEGFLAEVTRAWEQEAVEAEDLEGVRVVRVRFGVVLDRDGGALAKMLPAFKMGVGGRLGSGEQYMSWVHREDAVRAVVHLLDTRTAAGVYNVTAPTPLTNREFTEQLGRALRRPTVLPVPKFALKLAFGEMAEATLLDGQRATSRRLPDSGFRFKHPTLPEALRAIFG